MRVDRCSSPTTHYTVQWCRVCKILFCLLQLQHMANTLCRTTASISGRQVQTPQKYLLTSDNFSTNHTSVTCFHVPNILPAWDFAHKQSFKVQITNLRCTTKVTDAFKCVQTVLECSFLSAACSCIKCKMIMAVSVEHLAA